MPRHFRTSRPPVRPPATAEEGAAHVRALLVPLFDRKDGTGADWRLLLESLFRAGFQIADGWQDDERRRRVMERVYPGAYDRAAGNTDASTEGQGPVAASPSNAAPAKAP